MSQMVQAINGALRPPGRTGELGAPTHGSDEASAAICRAFADRGALG